MNIVDAVGQKLGAVRVKNTKILGVVTPVFRVYEYTLRSDLAFIESIQRQNDTHCLIQWWCIGDGQLNSNYVPNDFAVTGLDGQEAIAFLNEYERFKTKTIWQNLRMGMNIGYSPELFLQSDGKIVPPSDFLSKRGIKMVNDARTEHTYYRGFRAQPWVIAGGCLEERANLLWSNLQTMLTKGKTVYPQLKFSPSSLVKIDPLLLEKAADDQVIFGDAGTNNLNIYGIKQPKPDYRKVLTRPASGPIHLGITRKVAEDNTKILVRALDAIIGVACVSLFASFDDPKRREYVGAAGSYRIHEHGLEYRTLSNAWMLHPVIHHLVVDIARKTAAFGFLGHMKLWNATEEETIDTIMTCNVDKARDILSRNRDMFLQVIQSVHRHDEREAAIVNHVFMHGLESLCADPLNIERNWGLNNTAIWRAQRYDRWYQAKAPADLGYKI